MSNTIWAGTRKGLVELQRSASSWQVGTVHFEGKPISMLLDDANTGRLYAATNEGHFGAHMHVSEDKGKSWKEISMPAYEKSDAPNTPTVSEIWSLESAGGGVLWAGTKPGGLFKSEDGGETWALCEALWNHPLRLKWFGGGTDLPVVHSIAIAPRNAQHLTIAVSCGGVWRSTDNGASWNAFCNGMRAEYVPPEQQFVAEIQDPHRLVQSPADPKTFWVQHHNGIFVTSDDLANWQEIHKAGPSTFGFAVSTHPKNAKTAWFVPAIKDEYRYPVDGKLVVTRTRYGGQSFETITQGLPQAHFYDLIYRHCLDVDVPVIV